jgi:hypothetical protein
VVPSKTIGLVEGIALKRRIKANPVIFAVVPQEDGTYDVEAPDGGAPSFWLSSEAWPRVLISFRTEAEAEAWITKLKGMIN